MAETESGVECFRAVPCRSERSLFSRTKPWEWSPFHQATDMMTNAAEELGIKKEDDEKEKRQVVSSSACCLEKKFRQVDNKPTVDYPQLSEEGSRSFGFLRSLPEADRIGQNCLQSASCEAGLQDDLGVWSSVPIEIIENTSTAETHTTTIQDNSKVAEKSQNMQVKQEYESEDEVMDNGDMDDESQDDGWHHGEMDDDDAQDDEYETDSATEDGQDEVAPALHIDNKENDEPVCNVYSDNPYNLPPRGRNGRFRNLLNIRRALLMKRRLARQEDIEGADVNDSDFDPRLESSDSDASDDCRPLPKNKAWFKKQKKTHKPLKESQKKNIMPTELEKDGPKNLSKKNKTVTQSASAKGRMLPLKLKCRLCQELYGDMAEMKEHIIKIHGNQQTLMPKKHQDKVVKQKMMGQIDVADALGDFEVSALSIMMRHCQTCYEYIPEKTIGRHLSGHRKTSALVSCSECDKTYTTNRALTRHKRIKHSGSTSASIPWSLCCQKFGSKSALKFHKIFKHRSGSVDAPAPGHQCEICGKAFYKLEHLKNHRAMHMTVKPWQCPDCGKGFARKTNMDTHRRVHSGIKPYVCELCKEAYTHNVSLKMHKKKKHGIDMWDMLKKQV